MLYSDLVSEVLPDVPGCPDITIERAIRDAAIEFFDASCAYTVDQDGEVVAAGTDVIDLAIPTGTRLVQVLRAQLGQTPLHQMSRDDLFRSGRPWQTDVGRPQLVTFESDRAVRLVPIADQTLAELLYIRFAVAPTRASSSIPDAIGERYFRELVYGAKSIVMLMPGMVWSNQQLGAAYRDLFLRGVREAKLTVAQDMVTAQRHSRIRRVV